MLSAEQAWWQEKLKEEAAARKAANQSARPKVLPSLPSTGMPTPGSNSDKGGKDISVDLLCCGCRAFCFDYLVWVTGERPDLRISVAHVPNQKAMRNRARFATSGST